MDWEKFKSVYRDRAKILEGVKNTIFKEEDIEAIAKMRFSICEECESLDEEGSKCLSPVTKPCCGECGCSLAFKTRSLSSSCPLNKWDALTEES